MNLLPEEVSTWVGKQRGTFDESLLTVAGHAVEIVLNDPSRSELCELWNEAADEDRDAWRAVTAGLMERLR